MLKQITRENWIKALRSGKYKQAKGFLKSGNGKNSRFCCLGVACDLAGVILRKNTRLHYISTEYGIDDDDLMTCGIPLFKETKEVAEMLNLSLDDCLYLADLNDRQFTFEYIADKIESGKFEQ